MKEYTTEAQRHREEQERLFYSLCLCVSVVKEDNELPRH